MDGNNSHQTGRSVVIIDWSMIYTAEIFTIVFLSILAILTTVINGFTLHAIYKDPLRCFRTPLTTFISGIILFDFMTGIVVEPSIAAIYAISYIHRGITQQTYLRLSRLAQMFALVTMNSSFITFLALAIAQFLALAKPRIYEKYFTLSNCRLILAMIWSYSIFFAILPEMFKITLYAYFTADIILHNTIVTLIIIIIYIATFVYFQTKIAPMLANVEQNDDNATPQERGPQVQREFLLGTFLLTLILILTVFPITIALYIWIFQSKGPLDIAIQKYVAVMYCENILYLKFLWDPAVLVLRIPTYRKSVVMIFSGVLPGSANVGGVVTYNRQADDAENRIEEETIVDEDRATSRNEVQA